MKSIAIPAILVLALLAGFVTGSFRGVKADCMKQNGSCRSGCGSRASDCSGYCQWEDCGRLLSMRFADFGDDSYTDVCLSDVITECWLSFCPGVPGCSQ